jgi:hypothetical protein
LAWRSCPPPGAAQRRSLPGFENLEGLRLRFAARRPAGDASRRRLAIHDPVERHLGVAARREVHLTDLTVVERQENGKRRRCRSQTFG